MNTNTGQLRLGYNLTKVLETTRVWTWTHIHVKH